jgi:hypothetical protein
MFAQDAEKPTKRITIKGEMDQTKWIIESLDKYRKQKSLGSQIELLGVAVGGVSFGFSDKPDNQRIFLISGGVVVLIGYIVSTNAEHYLSKKNLTLTGNGLALRF